MKSVGMGYNAKVNANDLKAENEALKAKIVELEEALKAPKPKK